MRYNWSSFTVYFSHKNTIVNPVFDHFFAVTKVRIERVEFNPSQLQRSGCGKIGNGLYPRPKLTWEDFVPLAQCTLIGGLMWYSTVLKWRSASFKVRGSAPGRSTPGEAHQEDMIPWIQFGADRMSLSKGRLTENDQDEVILKRMEGDLFVRGATRSGKVVKIRCSWERWRGYSDFRKRVRNDSWVIDLLGDLGF